MARYSSRKANAVVPVVAAISGIVLLCLFVGLSIFLMLAAFGLLTRSIGFVLGKSPSQKNHINKEISFPVYVLHENDQPIVHSHFVRALNPPARIVAVAAITETESSVASLVPFASDGTYFSPSLRSPRAKTFTVGEKGDEIRFHSYQDALDYR